MTINNHYAPLICYNAAELRPLVYQHGNKLTFVSKRVILSPIDILDSYYFIDKGRARYVTTGTEGEERILGILEQDSFFGVVPILLPDQTFNLFVITEIPTVIYTLNKDTFMNLLNSSTTFRDSTLRGLATQIIMLMSQIQSLSFKSCKDRLYELFLASTIKQHLVDQHWYKLKYQYTQEDMGKIIGASRITVTRIINELCSEDLIRIVNRKIEVHAYNKLSS